MEEEKTGIDIEATDLADLPEEMQVDVDSVSLEDLVGETVIICSYREKDSEFGKNKYIIMDILHEGVMVEVSTGSGSVVKQIIKAETRLPIRAKVMQKGRKFYLE